jgi:hypothetical protein
MGIIRVNSTHFPASYQGATTVSSKADIETAILDMRACADNSTERVYLTRGATIRDVFAQFRDGTDGETGGADWARSLSEFRDAIQSTGARYEECDRVSVRAAWVYGETEWGHGATLDPEGS